MPTGTPCRGPCVGLRSHARACVSAASGLRYSQALTLSSRAVIRSRQAVTSASLVRVPAAIAWAASTPVNACRGCIRISTLQQNCHKCSLTIRTASAPSELGGSWNGLSNQHYLFQLRPQGCCNRKFDHSDVVLNLCH